MHAEEGDMIKCVWDSTSTTLNRLYKVIDVGVTLGIKYYEIENDYGQSIRFSRSSFVKVNVKNKGKYSIL